MEKNITNKRLVFKTHLNQPEKIETAQQSNVQKEKKTFFR